MSTLDQEFDRERYQRHLALPQFTDESQARLARASVLVVGAGGLGSPVCLYLAAAGVGRIGIVDDDVVDLSNLQRQVLHDTPSIGHAKTSSARKRLLELNPTITVETYPERLSSQNAHRIADGYDIIVDGADNFGTRYLVNDLSVLLGIPNVQGSVYQFEGQVSVFDAKRGPCYRCVYPNAPDSGSILNCADAGVLGVLPGTIGMLMATEVIKLITGIGEPLVGRMLVYDALKTRFRELKITKDPKCAICSEHPSILDLLDAEALCQNAQTEIPTSQSARTNSNERVTRNGMSTKTNTMIVPEISVEELDELRRENEPHILIDCREVNEFQKWNIGGTLIPLSEFATRYNEIPKEGRVIIHCRTGNRSGQAVAFLRKAGWDNVENLTGGIVAWAEKIDPSVTSGQ